MFDENVKFKYTWRPYQKRVLDNANLYLKDGKINVVAAPGSGKTVLGLELLVRHNKPVIILVPTVTIRNQWVDRFLSLFVNNKDSVNYISTNIYDLKSFNVVTYQALHYAYKKQKMKESDNLDDVALDKEFVTDTTVIKEYDLIDSLKKCKISTVVLDEAHHLKSEWWKSLTAVVNALDNTTVISLTATPPYDVEYSEFNKYLELCGQIDETISVPELVAANNLCPHQDYIYFNMPTDVELNEIRKYKENLNIEIEKIKKDKVFLEAIKSHKYINAPYSYEEEILENVEYYSSMVIYLNSCGVSLSRDNLQILGHNRKIPALSISWLEILLKNVIITDRKNYANYESKISEIENSLNRLGVTEKNQVMLLNNSYLEKYFANSIGKLNSISKIVQIESDNLKENLRMVILTDYIRKEYMSDESINLNKLGVFPIFLNIRKNNPSIKMAILTGSYFVIPKDLKDNLLGLCEAHGVEVSKVSFDELKIDDDYVIINVVNNLKNKVMSLVSKLFAAGLLNIIVGTKSLLGEGWDEPSINTLVLASFVGSYMLSNQMRGRAIRVNKYPKKTANIWHLVCVSPSIDGKDSSIENSDYNTLKRRFEAFPGLGYNSNIISSGIDRLNINENFTKESIDNTNQKMESYAIKRDEMYNNWKNAINMTTVDKAKLIQNLEANEEDVQMKKSWFSSSGLVIAIIILVILILFAILNPLKLRFLYIIGVIISLIYVIVKNSKIKRLSNSNENIKEMGKIVLNSLYRCGFIKTGISRINVVVKSGRKIGSLCCYITGATEVENNIFVTALKEVYAKTINQRYIITRLNKKLEDINDYYNVPTVLGQNKEMAQVFKTYFEKRIGKCDLVYTKSAEGRRYLLKARMKSLGFKDKIKTKEDWLYWK